MPRGHYKRRKKKVTEKPVTKKTIMDSKHTAHIIFNSKTGEIVSTGTGKISEDSLAIDQSVQHITTLPKAWSLEKIDVITHKK